MIYKTNGSAGYGKTQSLVDKAIELTAANIPHLIITPTNKAAMVLNSRLILAGLKPSAKTLHSTIYEWQCGEQIGVKQTRYIDPETGKLAVDAKGKPAFREEPEFKWVKTIRRNIEGNVVIVDEASMVSAGVWYDLDTCGLFPEIHTFGDEKQLPPVEQYQDLSDEHRAYFQFWHKLPATKTLKVNYRQAGSLKEFVETCEPSIFARYPGIPCPLFVGENFAVHASSVEDDEMLELMMQADIIVTPYNRVRHLCNTIVRRETAKRAGLPFDTMPVDGDKIIMCEPVKQTIAGRHGATKVVTIAKNVGATITRVRDIDRSAGLIVADLVDEMGTEHRSQMLSLAKLTGKPCSIKEAASFEYAYAITAHKAQGAQWAKVLYLDSAFPTDLDKLRYVAITRASQQLRIVTGITTATEASDAHKSILVRVFNKI